MTDPEDQLRHLLRGLSVSEPMPEDVSQRLDETLERLVAGRAERPSFSIRRMLAVGAVAASVVGVVALGVGTLTHSPVGSSMTSSMPGNLATSGPELPSANATDQATQSLEGRISPLESFSAGTVKVPRGSGPSFTSDDLSGQIRAWWDAMPTLTPGETCPGPWLSGPAQAVPAQLDGSPAALLVFPPQGTDQVLELFSCAAVEQAAATVQVTAH